MVRIWKITAVWLAVAAVLLTGGCSGKSTSGAGISETAETAAAAVSETAETEKAVTEAPAGAERRNGNEGKPGYADTRETEAGGPGAELTAADTAESGDKDIGAVAELIQEAVADKDMEALADMCAFPLELETSDEKLNFENRAEFLKQNPDLIFGDDLMVAIAGIDTATLELEADGVTMGEESTYIRYEKMKDGTFRIIAIRE